MGRVIYKIRQHHIGCPDIFVTVVTRCTEPDRCSCQAYVRPGQVVGKGDYLTKTDFLEQDLGGFLFVGRIPNADSGTGDDAAEVGRLDARLFGSLLDQSGSFRCQTLAVEGHGRPTIAAVDNRGIALNVLQVQAALDGTVALGLHPPVAPNHQQP